MSEYQQPATSEKSWLIIVYDLMLVCPTTAQQQLYYIVNNERDCRTQLTIVPISDLLIREAERR